MGKRKRRSPQEPQSTNNPFGPLTYAQMAARPAAAPEAMDTRPDGEASPAPAPEADVTAEDMSQIFGSEDDMEVVGPGKEEADAMDVAAADEGEDKLSPVEEVRAQIEKVRTEIKALIGESGETLTVPDFDEKYQKEFVAPKTIPGTASWLRWSPEQPATEEYIAQKRNEHDLACSKEQLSGMQKWLSDAQRFMLTGTSGKPQERDKLKSSDLSERLGSFLKQGGSQVGKEQIAGVRAAYLSQVNEAQRQHRVKMKDVHQEITGETIELRRPKF